MFDSHSQSQDCVRTPEFLFECKNGQLEDCEEPFSDKKCMEIESRTAPVMLLPFIVLN